MDGRLLLGGFGVVLEAELVVCSVAEGLVGRVAAAAEGDSGLVGDIPLVAV